MSFSVATVVFFNKSGTAKSRSDLTFSTNHIKFPTLVLHSFNSFLFNRDSPLPLQKLASFLKLVHILPCLLRLVHLLFIPYGIQ